MRKILFMVNGLYGGGAEKVFQTLVSNLSRNKYDITIYSLHRENIDTSVYKGNFEYKVVFDKYRGSNPLLKPICNFFCKVRGKMFSILPSRLFYALFIRGKYDVEIAFIEGESTKILSGSTNRKSKKYAWVHVDLQKNAWTDFLYKSSEDERQHYLKFDRIFCVSKSVMDAFADKYRISKDRCSVMYNPIDPMEIIEKSKEKCSLPLANGLRMVSIGRLVEQKGFDRLLRVAVQLKNNGFKFEIIICGEGSERAQLENFIDENDLSDCVELLGYCDNPYVYIKNSDLMVCSSRAEGFSTVISEALILGLPIVSTNCAGVNELFGGYECGVIAENDEDSLYRALSDVLSNPDILKVYHEASLKRGRQFSLSNTISKMETLLDA